MKVPDFSDENFAGNASGVAIRYKLMGMENKAKNIDDYFDFGLVQRNKLINEVLNSGTFKWEDYNMEIKHERNIPVDIVEKAEVANKLMNTVSSEALIEYLPNEIIPDKDLEIERLKKGLFEGMEEV